MATRQGVISKFRRFHYGAQFAGELSAKTGRNLGGAGLVLWSAEIPVNAVYVRSPENNSLVWCWGRVSDVDVDVILKPLRNGQYKIDDADWIRADAAWGSDLIGAIQPPLDATKYDNVLVQSLNPGRVYPSNSGGLNVRILPHYYVDGSGNHVYYPDEDDLDLTASLPGSTDEWGWVKVGIDRSTNGIVVVGTSTPVSTSVELTPDDLAGIALGGDTPHAGVKLRNGQTGIPVERGDIIDCRDYAEAFSSSGAPADASYWTAKAETNLSGETNLGALTSGVLKHAVAAGVSTPATATPGTDYVIPSALTAVDDKVEAIKDATFIVSSASAALDAEITLATALASPPAIGGTTPASGKFTTATARVSSTNSVALAESVVSGDKGIQIGYDNATDQGKIQSIHQGTGLKQLTLNGAGGTVACGADLVVVGALSKGSGSFVIDHPLDPDNKTLSHGFVEAPRYDLIYRGRVTLVAGTAQVSIDDASKMASGTWAALCRDAQVFVSNNDGWTPVRGRMDTASGILMIEAQDVTCVDTVDWLVIAERNDAWVYEDPFTDNEGHYVPEHDKPVNARVDNPLALPARGQRRHPTATRR